MMDQRHNLSLTCPGEVLAAALASCLDKAIRMIANLKDLKLSRREVHASFGADVRGTLMTTGRPRWISNRASAG